MFKIVPWDSLKVNPNSLWWVHMGISLNERQITEETMKVKIFKNVLETGKVRSSDGLIT
jgi:hypothetical protein